ncbi:MAG: CtsR family transcriptional regulator [Clostridiales bacterium]|nr:CtsR family transcriptional regulator [Clostridiales bacterium]
MRISDAVANYILALLEEDDGCAEIQRNELAGTLGCVPSQINYVLTSRFTPEKGYLVESRRGGGGYIRITRIQMDRETGLMRMLHSIGTALDGASARSILNHLSDQKILDEMVVRAMAAAISDQSFASVPQPQRDILRAAMMKNMLITQM